MRIGLLFVVLSVAMLVVPPTQAEERLSPLATLRHIYRELDNMAAAAPAGKENQHQLVQSAANLLQNYLAIGEVAEHVYGRGWPRLSEDRQSTFVAYLERLLRQAMAQQLTQYRNVEKRLLEESIKGDTAVVKAEALRSGSTTSILYTLVKPADRWLIFDINIDGVSMVRNTTVQVRRAQRDGGFEGVMEALRRKVEEFN